MQKEKVMFESVKFGYGILCEGLEKQANNQGFTLSKKSASLERLRSAITELRFGIDLPDSLYDKLIVRLHKLVVKSLVKK